MGDGRRSTVKERGPGLGVRNEKDPRLHASTPISGSRSGRESVWARLPAVACCCTKTTQLSQIRRNAHQVTPVSAALLLLFSLPVTQSSWSKTPSGHVMTTLKTMWYKYTDLLPVY